MLPGPTLIVACPTCDFLMTQQTWLSYSHWGGESWSDGSWSDRGLNPICSEVSKCKGCDNFFWVEDVKVRKTLKFTFTHLRKKYKNIPSIEALTLEELWEAVSFRIAKTRSKEFYLRTHLWWNLNRVLNDKPKYYVDYRLGLQVTYKELEEIFENNLIKLDTFLNEKNPEHRFKKAEIRRNLGDFKGCLKYLSDLPEGYDWVAKQIKREAKKKNKKLFKIKQAPLPKTMTA